MKLRSIAELLSADILTGHERLDTDIRHALGADLMSDVLTAPGQDTVLLTGLTNLQVMRTAEMVDIKAVIFVRGKRPCKDVLRLADELGIPVLVTRLSMFATCGVLHQAGIEA